MMAHQPEDVELARKDDHNTLELRSLRMLSARINKLEAELFELRFIYDTLKERTPNNRWE